MKKEIMVGERIR